MPATVVKGVSFGIVAMAFDDVEEQTQDTAPTQEPR